MKIATGHAFHKQVAEAAEAISPGIEWALIDRDGNWSIPPEGSEIIVYASDAYTKAWVDAVTSMTPPKWAHTEDAGIDGPFYDSMRANKVIVTHSPGANAPEVAELAFSGLIWGAKRLSAFRESQARHEWNKIDLQALSACTVLVVGLGAIGSRVAKFAKAFDMTVLGIRQSSDPVDNIDRQGTAADLHDMLGEADFVVLAIPISGQSANMIDGAALGKMKPTATLVNVGRGALVDIDALREALASNSIAQAFLDVLPVEPWPADDPLWDMPNVFITPHNGARTPLYIQRVGDIFLDNLRRYVDGNDLTNRAF